MNAYRSPQGSRREGLEPQLSRMPAGLAISAICAVVWLIAIATGQDGPMWDSKLGQWMSLRTVHFDLRGLLVSPYLHENVFHLLANIAAILFAGRLLEARWGSWRFSLFFLGSGIGCGLVVHAVDLAFSWRDPAHAGSISFGASGAALACLTSYTLLSEDRPVLGFFTERYLIWSGMLLGSGLLVLLERIDRSLDPIPPVLLTPQLAGLALGAVLSLALMRWELFSSRRPVRSHRSHEKIIDIRRRVDQLLEKISRDGMRSLSQEERSFLRDASKLFRNRR